MSLARCALIAALICSSVAALPSPASAAPVTIEATPSLDGNTNCPWGYPAVATSGQSIVAPAGADTLDSFSFYLSEFDDSLVPGPAPGPASITYHAYVYAWDGVKAVGPALWTSAEQTVTISGSTPVQVTTVTSGVPVTPGQAYVVFFSISEDYLENQPGDQVCFAQAQSAYAGGAWVFQNNGADTSTWTTQAWSPADDNAFTATFSSSAPEPIYDFDGFYAPVDNKDLAGNYVLNQVRAGSAIPVRFSLGGDRGMDIFEVGYPRSQAIACDSDAEVDGVEQTVNAGSSELSYAPGSDTYTYVWKTDRAWSDSCRQLVVRFDDGTTARANFTFTN